MTNTFNQVLRDMRRTHRNLFDERALQPPVDPAVEIEEFEMPKEGEFRESPERNFVDQVDSDGLNVWPEIPKDEEDYDWGHEAREERRPFENRPHVTGVELLAIYLPFHFYPDHHWGIRFFENPMKRFVDRVSAEASHRGLPYPWNWLLKAVTYAVARHEFSHYLTELEALDIELKSGRKVYRPYWDTVYKKTYPGLDCIEETICSVWKWDNAVIRAPASRQWLFRDIIAKTPGPAYAEAAKYDAEGIRPVEDRLAAQLNQCAIYPTNIPPVWGTFPRAYVQPWTRYENVTYTMNRSAGGTLGRVLGAGRPIRKTMRIYHR